MSDGGYTIPVSIKVIELSYLDEDNRKKLQVLKRNKDFDRAKLLSLERQLCINNPKRNEYIINIINQSKTNTLALFHNVKDGYGKYIFSEVQEYFRGNDKYKVVYIDEADQLTDAAFNSLRGNIEKFVNTGRFIFTCNYLSKIPAPIQSRFQLYEFKKLTTEYITEFTKQVLQKENITYSDDDLSFVISGLYPDVRKIISTLNTRSSSGTLTVNRSEMVTEEKKVIASFVDLIDGIMNGNGLNFSTNIDIITKLTSEKDLDYKSIYEVLFYERKIFPAVKIIVNKYTNSHNDCMIPSMHFMSMVFESISVCKQYKATVGK